MCLGCAVAHGGTVSALPQRCGIVIGAQGGNRPAGVSAEGVSGEHSSPGRSFAPTLCLGHYQSLPQLKILWVNLLFELRVNKCDKGHNSVVILGVLLDDFAHVIVLCVIWVVIKNTSSIPCSASVCN